MNARSFLVSGFAFSCFFHAAFFCLVAPKADVPLRVRPRTELIFLGGILKEVDVRPSGTMARPTRNLNIPKKVAGDSPGRFEDTGRFPEKPFLTLPKEERKKYPQEAPSAVSSLTRDQLTFGLLDVGQYFLNIDFSDIAKAVARDEFSGVLEYEAFFSASGAIERLRRTMGSGDPFLDNTIALRLKRGILKSPWAQEGARYRLRLILKSAGSAYVSN